METVRKVSVLGTDLDMLHESLKNFRGYAEISSVEPVQETKPIHKKKAVLAICASGEGTAQRIKELIERAVNKRQETELEVLALSIVEVKEELPVIQKEYQIIATTGITDLNIQAPFIPLERFIDQNIEVILDQLLMESEMEIQKEYQIIATTGITDLNIQAPFIPLERFIDQNIEVILDQLLMESEMEETEFVSLDEETAKKTCVEFISENFIFINGSKLIDPMWQFSTQISQTMGIGDEEYGFKINLVMHTAGMIERIIRNETLTVEENELTNTTSDPLYNQLTASVVLLEDKIKVKVPIEEMYYLLRLVHNQLDKKEYTMP